MLVTDLGRLDGWSSALIEAFFFRPDVVAFEGAVELTEEGDGEALPVDDGPRSSCTRFI